MPRDTARDLAREDATIALRESAMAHARLIYGREHVTKDRAQALLLDTLVSLAGPGEFSRIALFLKEHVTNWNACDEREAETWREIENAANTMRTDAEGRLQGEWDSTPHSFRGVAV